MPHPLPSKTLFYGDNLLTLRDFISSEDLLNGKRREQPPVGANVIFRRAEKVKKGEQGNCCKP